MLANKLGLKEEDVLKKEVLKERVKARPWLGGCAQHADALALPMLGLPHCALTGNRPVRAAAADARAGGREAGA